MSFIPFVKECENYRENITDAQKVWSRFSESNKETLSSFHKKKIVAFIWESNFLEGTLPKEAKEADTKEDLMKFIDPVPAKLPVNQSVSQQLLNHLKAYLHLCSKDSVTQQLPTLSEELIKRTHEVMMQGLKTDDGVKVNAGIYRTISVHAGIHVFPSFKCVPSNMAKIVTEYESKASNAHDPYQLASWLLFHVVSLHPFEDGNGRLSRLLWCYSLIRDGLPFPVVLTSGHRRSQKHLVMCLERDRRLSVSDQSNLTSLSLVSVGKAWESFLVENKPLDMME